jgi:hypothetical protein
MFSLSCTTTASASAREARGAAAAGSLVVLDGAGVFMSTLVSKERCASGLTFVELVIHGGAIHGAIG